MASPSKSPSSSARRVARKNAVIMAAGPDSCAAALAALSVPGAQAGSPGTGVVGRCRGPEDGHTTSEVLRAMRAIASARLVAKRLGQRVRAQVYRSKIVKEIESTERTYASQLLAISVQLRTPLLKSKWKDKADMLFSTLPLIYVIHTKLLRELRGVVCSWTSTSRLTEVFIPFLPSLQEAYEPYYASHGQAVAFYVEEKAKSSKFAEFVQGLISASPMLQGKDLKSLLILPVQRLPRIILLLRELIKHTPAEHCDYAALQALVTNIKRILDRIDTNNQRVEDDRVLDTFVDTVKGANELLSHVVDLKFIADGGLTVRLYGAEHSACNPLESTGSSADDSPQVIPRHPSGHLMPTPPRTRPASNTRPRTSQSAHTLPDFPSSQSAHTLPAFPPSSPHGEHNAPQRRGSVEAVDPLPTLTDRRQHFIQAKRDQQHKSSESLIFLGGEPLPGANVIPSSSARLSLPYDAHRKSFTGYTLDAQLNFNAPRRERSLSVSASRPPAVTPPTPQELRSTFSGQPDSSGSAEDTPSLPPPSSSGKSRTKSFSTPPPDKKDRRKLFSKEKVHPASVSAMALPSFALVEAKANRKSPAPDRGNATARQNITLPLPLGRRGRSKSFNESNPPPLLVQADHHRAEHHSKSPARGKTPMLHSLAPPAGGDKSSRRKMLGSEKQRTSMLDLLITSTPDAGDAGSPMDAYVYIFKSAIVCAKRITSKAKRLGEALKHTHYKFTDPRLVVLSRGATLTSQPPGDAPGSDKHGTAIKHPSPHSLSCLCPAGTPLITLYFDTVEEKTKWSAFLEKAIPEDDEE